MHRNEHVMYVWVDALTNYITGASRAEHSRIRALLRSSFAAVISKMMTLPTARIKLRLSWAHFSASFGPSTLKTFGNRKFTIINLPNLFGAEVVMYSRENQPIFNLPPPELMRS
jgi:hypothetical protein